MIWSEPCFFIMSVNYLCNVVLFVPCENWELCCVLVVCEPFVICLMLATSANCLILNWFVNFHITACGFSLQRVKYWHIACGFSLHVTVLIFSYMCIDYIESKEWTWSYASSETQIMQGMCSSVTHVLFPSHVLYMFCDLWNYARYLTCKIDIYI